jgi:hypothetical protein
MHTVHYPNPQGTDGEPFIAAAMGLMFSVESPTVELSEADVAIIDTFFESLDLGS